MVALLEQRRRRTGLLFSTRSAAGADILFERGLGVALEESAVALNELEVIGVHLVDDVRGAGVA